MATHACLCLGCMGALLTAALPAPRLLASLEAGVRLSCPPPSCVPHPPACSGRVFEAVYQGEYVAVKEIDLSTSAANHQTFLSVGWGVEAEVSHSWPCLLCWTAAAAAAAATATAAFPVAAASKLLLLLRTLPLLLLLLRMLPLLLPGCLKALASPLPPQLPP